MRKLLARYTNLYTNIRARLGSRPWLTEPGLANTVAARLQTVVGCLGTRVNIDVAGPSRQGGLPAIFWLAGGRGLQANTTSNQ
jgi:hypothetical protein